MNLVLTQKSPKQFRFTFATIILTEKPKQVNIVKETKSCEKVEFMRKAAVS